MGGTIPGLGTGPCPPLSGKVVWWVCLQEAVCARDGEGPEGGLAVSWGCPEGAGPQGASGCQRLAFCVLGARADP